MTAALQGTSMAKTEPKRIEVPAWRVRLAVASDMGFVYASWLNSAHQTYPNNHAEDWFPEARAAAQRIMDSSVVAVAATQVDTNDLLGHMVFGRWRKTIVVHYAFTKPDARRHGVLKSLLDFANYDGHPVVLTAPAQDPDVMRALMKRYIYDQRVLPLMQRGDR